MMRFLIYLVCSLSTLGALSGHAQVAHAQPPPPVTIVDDTGHRVSLPAPATRIIALYGAFNEILFGMDLGHTLLARTNADTYPLPVANLPAIGTHMRPNLELVTGLSPDLVLQMSGRKEAGQAVARLRALHIPVAVFHVVDFTGLFSVIHRLGVLTGEQQRAHTLVRALQQRLTAVEQAVADLPRPSVFFEARYPNLLGAGRASIITDIITRAGGVNIMKTDRKLERLSEEALLQHDPQVYLIQQGPMNKTPVPLLARPHFRTLQAVRHNRWYIVDEARFSRPGPRAVSAVEELARFLHPLQFKAAKPATQGEF